MDEHILPAVRANVFEIPTHPRIEYEGLGLKYLHSNVSLMLEVARKHNGVAYGGYVRDVVTRILANNFDSVSTKDVDIWFRDSTSRDSFILEYRSLLRDVIPTTFNHPSEGTNSIVMGLFDTYQSFLIYVDCVVSNVFPVYDLDVNYLTFDVSNGKLTAMSQYNLCDILNNIRNKECVPTSVCMDFLTKELSQSATQEQRGLAMKIRKRVIERFVIGGWSLKHSNGTPFTLSCRCCCPSLASNCKRQPHYEHSLTITKAPK